MASDGDGKETEERKYKEGADETFVLEGQCRRRWAAYVRAMEGKGSGNGKPPGLWTNRVFLSQTRCNIFLLYDYNGSFIATLQKRHFYHHLSSNTLVHVYGVYPQGNRMESITSSFRSLERLSSSAVAATSM